MLGEPVSPAPLDVSVGISSEVDAAKKLLRASGLPLAGLEYTRLWGLGLGGQLVGVGGYERYGDLALLRSLAVVPEERGRGFGGALLEHLLRTLRDGGVTTVYGLTTTVPGWLERSGFRAVARDSLPYSGLPNSSGGRVRLRPGRSRKI